MNEVGMKATLQERAGYLDIHGNESFYIEIDSGARDGGTAGGNASTELLPGLRARQSNDGWQVYRLR